MTLAQMYKRIYANIGSDTEKKRQYVHDDDILEFINSALRMACLQGKCYNKTVDLDVLKDVPSYSLTATDVIDIYNVSDEDGNALTMTQPDKLGKIFNMDGQPMWWYYIGRIVTLYPTPTKDATYSVMYHALDVDLAISTDSPNIDEFLHGALVDFALASIYLRLGVLSLAQMYAQNFSSVSGISLSLINDKLGIKQQQQQTQGA